MAGKITKLLSFSVLATLVLGLIEAPLTHATFAQENKNYSYTQTIKVEKNIELSNSQTEYISAEVEGDFNFNSLALSWRDTLSGNARLGLEVQLYHKTWSKWYAVEPTIDGQDDSDFAHKDSFFITAPSSAFRYKFFIKGDGFQARAQIKDLEITLFNAEREPYQRAQSEFDGNFLSFADENFVAVTTTNSNSDLKIISRKEWGADESLNVSTKKDSEAETEDVELADVNKKFADELKVIRTVTQNAKGQKLKWPLEYPEKVKKIIIHHTATSDEALVASTSKDTEKTDYQQIVKNIQYYHAVKRGWGDIGYNYLIDPEGNIYEGRYGEAIGAHAAGSNHGSLGISVIGNYQDKEVPSEVLNSIVKLSADKAKKFDIQADGKSSFRGETDHNMLGHQDVTATSCPGKNLYALLPTIRKLTASAAQNEKSNLDYEFSDVSESYAVDINLNETKKITIKLKNIGKKSWGEGSYLVLDDGVVNAALLTIKKKEGIKLAVMKEKTVLPGKTGTFEFSVVSKTKSGMSELSLSPFIKVGTKTNKINHKIYLPVFVAEPIYTYELVKANLPPAYIKKGSKLDNVWVELKNTGNITWSKTENAVALGADGPRDRFSSFVKNKPFTRLAFLKEEVKPGATGKFYFNIQAPDAPGQYSESFTPVVEGVAWMKSKKMKFETYVYANEYEALISNVSFDQKLKVNQDATLKLSFKNSGGVVWKKGSLNVDITGAADIKVGKKEIQNKEVKPGEEITVTVTLKPNALAKDGSLSIMPKIGNEKLLKQDKTLSYKITNKKTTDKKTTAKKETAQAASSTNNDNIRIKIGFDGNPKIKSAKGMTLYSGTSKVETYAANDEVEVTYKNKKYQVKKGTTTRTVSLPPKFIPKSSGIIEISNFERVPAWNKDLNDNKFRGQLEVVWSDNKLITVNELPLEDYLKGLAENGNDEEMEKIKALIVAARTYAKYYMTVAEKFPGKPWHLDDDPEVSQKYLGYGYELRAPRAVEAVEATEGEVITFKGKLIKTPYFSQSAGRTLSAQEVWGWADTPYLQSVEDTYCDADELKGHGVGLSGCGARGLATAGKDYDEILKYFYIGVDIGK